jgi:hypothetical protein
VILYYLDASARVKGYYSELGTFNVEDRLVFVASERELKKAAHSSSLAVIDPEEHEKEGAAPGDGAQEEDKPSWWFG